MSLSEYIISLIIVGVITLILSLLFFSFNTWLGIFIHYVLFYSIGVLDEKSSNKRNS